MDTQTLLTAINTVLPAVEQGTTTPILSNLLVADGNIYGTGMETRIKAPLEYSGKPFTAPGKLFRDLVRSLPQGEVSLNMSGTKLVVTAAGVKSELATMPAQDYPAWPNKPVTPVALLDAKAYEHLMSVAWAVPTKDPRRQLNGVHLVAKDGKLTAEATDGKCAAWATVDAVGECDVIVPLAALKALPEANIAVGENCVELSLVGIVVHTQTIGDKFPDLGKVKPKKFSAELEVPVEPLIDALRRARIFCGVNGVDIVVADGAATVCAESPDVGTFAEVVPGVEGSATLSLNPDFLAAALTGAGESVALRAVVAGPMLVDDRALVMQIKRKGGETNG